MSYQIATFPHPRAVEVIGTYATFAEAEADARARFNIAFFDVDTLVAYPAADFITDTGAIYSIDPVKGA